MDVFKLKQELVRGMSTCTCFGSDELSAIYVRSIEGDKVNVEVWLKVRTSRFLRERVRVVRGMSSICGDLSLKLHSLTTTYIPNFKNMTAIA